VDRYWFVDADDRIAPGSLRAIAARLTAEEPDLLVIDHARLDWLGAQQPHTAPAVLRRVGAAGPVSLAAEPDLLTLTPAAWSKVVRRGFLTHARLRFDAGGYEELAFTYPALVAADRISALGEVCYHERQPRIRPHGPRHFEVFDQWSRALDRLDRMGRRAESFRDTVVDQMVGQLLTLQTRLAPHRRRSFFRELSRLYHRYHRAVAAPPPERLERLRQHLIASNGYRRYRALGLAQQTVDRTRGWAAAGLDAAARAARELAAGAGAVAGHAYYQVQRRLPLDERLAVYASYWYRGMTCNPAAIYGAARDLAPRVRGVWVVDKQHRDTIPAGVDHVVAGSPAYYRALARARYLVNNVNFPDFVVKRPGSVHVQTHHGTPVKRMGLDRPAPSSHDLMHRCDRWDFSLSSNAHSSQVWERAYPARYETLEYGYPRNDRLALAEPAEIISARADLGARGRTVVLYAPTHRDYAGEELELLDAEHLADALGPKVLLLLRAHYRHPQALYRTHPRVREVTNHPSIEDLLLASDILVTDYSSVMFDYAVLDRPIVIYAPDWDTYRRTRGVTFDLLAEPPGVVATTQADLVDAFTTGAALGEAATKARAQFRERFCYLDDGRAADRVVRRVFSDLLG
jgi:CDP-glycerol glycerophosphotransferase